MVRRRSPVESVAIDTDTHCSIEEQRRLLRASPFFSQLSQETVDTLQERFQQRHYHEGDFVQKAGDPANRLSVVAAGMVKVVRSTVDGQDVLLDFLGTSEHFGSLEELGDQTFREDVTAQTPCCILNTTADDFRAILRTYPVVALSTLELVANRLRSAHSAIEQLSAYPVERRVAATLLHLADKSGKNQGDAILIGMPLSRQDIADMTGAKVETVSRILSEFRREDLIDSGRRWISVLDRKALAGIAEGRPV